MSSKLIRDLASALENLFALPDPKKNVKASPTDTENEIHAKARLMVSPRYTVWVMAVVLVFLAAALGALAAGVLYQGLIGNSPKNPIHLAYGIPLAILAAVSYAGAYTLTLFRRDAIEKITMELRAPSPSLDRTLAKSDPFEQLTDINIDHLNKYYKQTYDQCDKSFSVAKNASNVGYYLIVGGIVLYLILSVAKWPVDTRAILLGVSTGSGVIMKLVSSLYFYLYNKTVSSLGTYHDKLYRVQNILLCLQFSEKIEDQTQRDKVRAHIIEMLLEQPHSDHSK